ncbi:hypothetical protein OPIT5_09740 [Opitutaceae bacterium TAV5]|nr:hypothetical protein OPIT5_09740 [Opitutaceae bacterium TAV5]
MHPRPLRSVPLLVLVALAVLSAAGPLRAAVTARIAEDAPAASVPVAAWAEPLASGGWRLYSRDDQGRRELTQHWTPPAAGQTITGLALRIQAGSSAPLDDSRLRISITTTPASSSGAPAGLAPGPLPDVLFSDDAVLPPNTGLQVYRKGRWLVLGFAEPLALPAGRPVALHLAFAAPKPGPQDIIFSIAPLTTRDTVTASGFAQEGGEWKWWRDKGVSGALVLRLLTDAPATSAAAAPAADASAPLPAETTASTGRWLRIDPRDPAAFPTLAAAAATARPGDTLWIAPGSGPYREELYIAKSGTPDAPVTVEGNGNEITGFDPVIFSPQRSATVTTDYPFVLRHRGVRLPEEASTGRFVAPSASSAITWDPATKTLTLGPEADPEGWEISTRYFVVRIQGVSHHRYRNLVASGARNDGFNLHGRGSGLLFENITGCHNLDEGFSAHDDILSEIREGRFFGNDNGMYNIQRSHTRVRDLLIWNNLGIGLCQREATLEGENIRIWGNGMVQLATEKSGVIRARNLVVHRNPYAARPWRTYMESAKSTAAPATLGGEIGRQPDALPGPGLVENPDPAPWQTAPAATP